MASVTVGDSIIYPPGAVWVLVKGQHDSGTINAVFGPYTEKWADFLLANMLDCSMYNWTKTRLLRDGSEYEPKTATAGEMTEPTASAPAAPAHQELSCTSANIERAWQPTVQAPVSSFGFIRQLSQIHK